jgi:uncharacterized protein (UPF0332 family)
MTLRECFEQGLLVRSKASRDKASQSIASSRNCLQKARDNLKIDNADVAVVMAYTSMFHAFRALLFADGVNERSHVCMLEYVKSKFPELRNLVVEADAYRRFRHTALYGLEVLVSEEDASASIKLAEEIRGSVAELVDRR